MGSFRYVFYVLALLYSTTSADAAVKRSSAISSLKRYGITTFCIANSRKNFIAKRSNGRYIAYRLSPRDRLRKNRVFMKSFRAAKLACFEGKLFAGSGGKKIPTLPRGEPPPPIPQLALWQQQMVTFGRMNCESLRDLNRSFDDILIDTYYDGELVFYQIAEYTEDNSWLECARLSESFYRDSYVVPNNGVVPGYWNFTSGFLRNYLATGETASKNALLLLARNGLYARDDTPPQEIADAATAREVAYAIVALLNAERAGEPRRARLAILVNTALSYITVWRSGNASFIKPFMVGLLSDALIKYQTATGDERILPALKGLWNQLWDTLWIPEAKAFRYLDRDTGEEGALNPAPDLNLLIAPAFAWIYHQTGDLTFLARADEIFVGGVTQAYLVNGKQFNQSYRWSFDFVRWRSEPPFIRE